MIVKKYFTLFVFLLSSFSFVFAQYARLDVADPRNWEQDKGTIEEATFSFEPKGIYTEVGMFLTFSARNTYFQAEDTLEVVLNFSLPEQAMVIDSWLWIEDQVVKADILDRWTASNIYEEIVRRRRDPSILTKNNNGRYELRIFPMAGNQTRKVKITYLLPTEWTTEQVYNTLPMSILQASKHPVKVSVRAWLAPEWKNPRLTGTSELPLYQQEQGFWEVEIGSDQIHSPWNLIVDAPLVEGVYLNHYEPDNVYQMVYIPELSLAIREQAQRKVLILIDYHRANTNNTNFPNLLEYIHQELSQKLSDQDVFNIMWSGLQINTYSPDWMSANQATVDQVMTDLKNFDFPTYSNLPNLLGGAINYVVKTEDNAQVLLFTSASQEGAPAVANNLIRDLVALRGDNRSAIHICDFQDENVQYHSVNNDWVEGNTYFYSNLSRMTGGSFINLYCCPDLRDNVQKLFREALGMKGVFDLYTTLENGFCYSRMELGENRDLVDLAEPIYQIGKYEGEFPFVIEAAGVFNDQVFSDAISIDESSIYSGDSIIGKTWIGNYIRQLEMQPPNNRTIAEIVDLSLKNRVLSLYTAFLALEPAQGGEVCNDCLNEDGENLTDIIDLTGLDSLLQMKAFPNPFREKVTIRITAQKPLDWDQFKASVFDLSGREITTLPTSSVGGNEVELEWNSKANDGRQAPSGIYYFVLQSPNNRYTLKLVKF